MADLPIPPVTDITRGDITRGVIDSDPILAFPCVAFYAYNIIRIRTSFSGVHVPRCRDLVFGDFRACRGDDDNRQTDFTPAHARGVKRHLLSEDMRIKRGHSDFN